MAQATAEDGGRVPMSPGLQATLLRAREYAASQSEAQVLLEHLLLALSEDADAGTVLESCHVDLARLRHDVAGYIGSLDDRVPPGTAGAPAISVALTQVLKYATLAAQQGRRASIDGAIVLAALVGDGRSMAASFLKAQGLTFEAAIQALRQTATRTAAGAEETLPAPPSPRPASVSDPSGGAASDPPSYSTRPLHAETILARARERVESRSNRADAQPRPAPSLGGQLTPPDTSTQGTPQAPLHAANGSTAGVVAETTAGAPSPTAAAAWTVAPEATANPSPSAEPPPNRDAHAPPQVAAAVEAFQRQQPHEPMRVAADDTFLAAGAAQQPSEPIRGRSPDGDTSPTRRRFDAPPATEESSHAPAPLGQPHQSAGWAPPPRPPSPPHRQGLPTEPVRAATPPNEASRPHQQRPVPPPQHASPPGPHPGAQPPWGETARDIRDGAPSYSAPPPPGASSGWRSDEPTFAARQPAIHPSQISCALPRSLRQGRAHILEVRIERPPLSGLRGHAQPFALRPEAVVARAIAVRLRSTNGSVTIDAGSPETQWDQSGAAASGRFGSDDAVWRFTVAPLKSGKAVLQLSIGARTLGADGVLAETQLPDQVHEVRIAPAYGSMLARAGSVALIALGGIVGIKILEGVLRMDVFFLIRQLLRF